MTLEAETIATSQAGWRGLGRAWLAYADNLSDARISAAAAETIDVPAWPRSRLGSAAYFAAGALFLLLVVSLKTAPGPGWLLITPVFLFLATLAACVSLPRRA
jgi:hypothetical protein